MSDSEQREPVGTADVGAADVGTADVGAADVGVGPIVLATSNGTGMGHLARQNAVAYALTERDAGARPTFFSLSTAVHVMAAEGWPAEYCPSHHRGWMPHLAWHRYLADRLQALLSETGARVLAFDGVAPYLGLLRMRPRMPGVAFVWVRRGMWRPEANGRLLRSATLFDRVVEPGDFAAEADRGPSRSAPAERVRPVSMISATKQLDRAAAAAELGLDPDRPTALVTLGAGTINDTATPQAAAISGFLADPEWQVAVTQLPLADGGGLAESPRVRVLRDVYPLARYLAAFDAAVGAGGYNTVHELLPARVPSVLVPNAATSTDDQVARGRWAASAGMALYASESASSVGEAVGRLLDSSVRAELRAACGTLPPVTGAAELASKLTDLAAGFGGGTGPSRRPGSASQASSASRSWRGRAASAELAAKELAMRSLGGGGVRLVRRLLGRNPPAAVSGPRPAPIVTDELDPEALRGEVPIEHVLAGSSEAYRARRERLVSRYYSAE